MPQSLTPRRRALLQSIFAVPVAGMYGMAQQPQPSPVIITPGTTTFGPPKPVNGECPTCHTKHPVPSRAELLKSYPPGVCFAGSGPSNVTLSVCRAPTADDMAKSIQQRCTFCSCLFVIDTVE